MTALQTTGMAPSADGRPEIFVPCVGGDGNTVQLWHLYQMTPAGGWSQWVSHGSPLARPSPESAAAHWSPPTPPVGST
jgi:hypothetical protein